MLENLIFKMILIIITAMLIDQINTTKLPRLKDQDFSKRTFPPAISDNLILVTINKSYLIMININPGINPEIENMII